jgi:hypothetical protein
VPSHYPQYYLGKNGGQAGALADLWQVDQVFAIKGDQVVRLSCDCPGNNYGIFRYYELEYCSQQFWLRVGHYFRADQLHQQPKQGNGLWRLLLQIALCFK